MKCPKCSSKDAVVKIMYGMPGIEMQNEYNEGKIMLGGCVIGPKAPDYHCKTCQYEWERGQRLYGHYVEK